MTMCGLSIAISLLGLMLAETSVAATAQPVRDSGPCAEITAACQAAGFTRADCGLRSMPLMQGTNQPRQALPADVWFSEPVREMTIFAEQYDFAVTLLLLENRYGYIQLDPERVEDAYVRFTSQT